MKRCFCCGSDKPLDGFYGHPGMKDGHLNKCKTCVKSYVARKRNCYLGDPSWIEKEILRCREKTRKQRAMGNVPNSSPEAKARWSSNNKQKRNAHLKVSRAIKLGVLEKKPCRVCGESAQAHHEDYSKPLDVEWLCPKHHAERHIQRREESRKRLYVRAA